METATRFGKPVPRVECWCRGHNVLVCGWWGQAPLLPAEGMSHRVRYLSERVIYLSLDVRKLEQHSQENCKISIKKTILFIPADSSIIIVSELFSGHNTFSSMLDAGSYRLITLVPQAKQVLC